MSDAASLTSDYEVAAYWRDRAEAAERRIKDLEALVPSRAGIEEAVAHMADLLRRVETAEARAKQVEAELAEHSEDKWYHCPISDAATCVAGELEVQVTELKADCAKWKARWRTARSSAIEQRMLWTRQSKELYWLRSERSRLSDACEAAHNLLMALLNAQAGSGSSEDATP